MASRPRIVRASGSYEFFAAMVQFQSQSPEPRATAMQFPLFGSIRHGLPACRLQADVVPMRRKSSYIIENPA